ncbi:MAG: hypothetical protein Q8P18_34060 [Pseudomonadota bacterium]|nr:hypothetical protein [Pseudomonadota bacterium]
MSPQPDPLPARSLAARLWVSPRVAHYALLAGLTALVPLPFVDAWLERRAHRSMYRVVAEEAGQPFDEAVLAVLAEDRSSLVLGCLGTAVIWPIKKLFRTFFYFLTIKDVIDGTAEATLRAAMVRAALARLPHDARVVRNAMDVTLGRHQYSPVSRAFFRGERPQAEWVANADRVDKSVAWIYQKAGGGPILAAFLHQLEGRPATPAAPVAPAAPPSAEAPS